MQLSLQATVNANVGRLQVARAPKAAGETIMLGRLFACFFGFGAVVACAVYDESLLPTKPVGGSGAGGTIGTGGEQTPTDGSAGAGGASDGAGGTVGSGGAGASGTGGTTPDIDSGRPDVSAGAGGSVASDAADAPSRTDVFDARIVDSSDVSMTPMCPLLIDDMESGQGQINDGCRIGFWFSYNDNTAGGVQTPLAGGVFNPSVLPTPRTPASLRAAHTFGSGYPSAGMGVNFNAPPMMARRPYDASAYIGVTFFVIGTGTLVFAMPTRDTDPAGGVCGEGGRGACYDHFQATVGPINTTSWRQVTILFSSLLQQHFGYQPPGGFDRSAVYGVQWSSINNNGTFDFWIDDVSFVTSTNDGGVQ